MKNVEPKVVEFCDNDWVGSMDDMKSTVGYAFLLGTGVFSLTSKKQDNVALSTAEAEYVSTTLARTQAMWLRKIMNDIGEKQEESTPFFWDNKSAIAMPKNPINHDATRHIKLKNHFIKDVVEEKEVNLVYCRIEEQVADIFTKTLPKIRFQCLRTLLGVQQLHVKGEG